MADSGDFTVQKKCVEDTENIVCKSHILDVDKTDCDFLCSLRGVSDEFDKLNLKSTYSSYNGSGDAPSSSFKSSLSADAAEFVPRWLQPVNDSRNLLNFEKFTLPNSNETSCLEMFPLNETDESVVNFIKEVISVLTLNPGDFGTIVPPLASQICSLLPHDPLLFHSVNLIVNESIKEPNFTYTGTRLCAYLMDHLDESAGHAFYNHLLSRCKEEFQNFEKLLFHDHARAIGIATFTAELYQNLPLNLEGSECQYTVVGENLCKLLINMISVATEDFVKCVCNLLKLTGANLEQETTGNGDNLKMSQLFNLLNQKADDFSLSLSPLCRMMIRRVLTLRQNNWELQDSCIINEGNHFTDVEPVLTKEEELFLDYCNMMEAQRRFEWSSEDTNIDEEMLKDFELFLENQS